jgi:hypothetical protein
MDQLYLKNPTQSKKSSNVNIWFTVIIIVCVLVLFGLVFYAIFKPSLVSQSPSFNNITVKGAAYFEDGVAIGGVNPFVSKKFSSSKSKQIKSILTTDPLELFSVNFDSRFTENVEILGNLDVDTLTVNGVTNLSGNINVVNAAVSGTLGVAGNTQLSNAAVSGTLGVVGNTQLSNAAVSGTLGVVGNTQLSNAAVSGTLGVVGNTQLSNAAVSGTLGVTGATQLSNAALSGTLNVVGNTQLSNAVVSGTLGVTGATQLYNNLNVNGNTIIKGTLGVTGGAVFGNSITSLSSNENYMSSIQIFNPSSTSFPRGRITATSSDLIIQGPQYNGGSVFVSKYDTGEEIAVFDTSTGTNAGSTQLQLVRSKLPDYKKVNNTYYRYSLNNTANITTGGYLTNWVGSTGTSNTQIQTVGLFTDAGWVCLKSGMYIVTGLIHYYSNNGAQPVLQKYPGDIVPADTYNMVYELIGVDIYNATLQRYIPIFEGDVCTIQSTIGSLSQYNDTTYLQFQLVQEFI